MGRAGIWGAGAAALGCRKMWGGAKQIGTQQVPSGTACAEPNQESLNRCLNNTRCAQKGETLNQRGVQKGREANSPCLHGGSWGSRDCPKHLEQHAGPEGISRSWSAPRMISGWFCGLSGPLILPCHPCRDGPSPMGQGQDAVGMSLCNAVPGTEPVLCSIPTQTSLWEHRLILDESTLLFYIYWRTYHLIILSLAWCCSSLFMISGFQMNMPYRARIYMEILTNLGGSALCVCSSNF